MLRVEHLVSGYGRLEVLHNVDLQLEPGRTAVVLGPNGAGKTTLCHTLSGVVPIRSGRLMTGDYDLSSTSSRERVRAGIIQVPEGRQVFPRMTVAENLRLGAFLRGEPTESELADIFALFPILRTRYSSQAGSLSGGEQQMLAFGRALLSRPKYLLLDEPSQGLAPRVVDQIGDVLKEVVSRGIAVLLVEQNIGLAEMVADHVYVLENGHCGSKSEPALIFSGDLIEKSYLGSEITAQ